jgi:hypothetical protein
MNYKIRRGDTLSQLAQRFHTSVSALARANGIQNVNLIYAGATLHVDSFERGPRARPPQGRPSVSSGVSNAPVHGSAAAQRLVAAARRVAMSMGGYRGLGLCATGVSRAIASALGISVHGNGNQIDNNLPRSHFRQVNMSLAQALKTPGLILTWEHTSSRLGSIYGHTAITTGDGRSSISDFIERDTLNAGGRTGLKVFVMV